MRERILWPLAKRFFAGPTVEDALAQACVLNKQGITVILNLAGEHIDATTPDPLKQIWFNEQTYHHLIYLIADERSRNKRFRAAVGIKNTQFGLDFDEKLAREKIFKLGRVAARARVPIEFDMEESRYTDVTLDIFEYVAVRHPLCRQTLQANLLRTVGDVIRLNRKKLRVRLTMGAYPEKITLPADIGANLQQYGELLLSSGGVSPLLEATRARIEERLYNFATPYREKLLALLRREANPVFTPNYEEVSTAYFECADRLFTDGKDPVFATVRDEARVTRLRELAAKRGKPLHLQMLYNFRPRWQERLTKEQDVILDVYVPFGEQWYPYASRRFRFFWNLFWQNPKRFPREMWKIYHD